MKKLLLLVALFITASFQSKALAADDIVVESDDFTVTVSNIIFYDFDFKVEPKDPNQKYQIGIRSATQMDEMPNGGSDEDFFAFEQEYFTMIAGWYGYTWQQTALMMAMSGTTEDKCSNLLGNLDWNEDYVFYVYGIDADGNFSTGITRCAFSTPSATPVDMTFEVTFDEITQTTVAATITPSVDNEPYFVDIQRDSFTSWYVENDELDAMVKKLVSYSLPMEYYEGKWISGGVHQIAKDEFTLKKKTNYNLIVVGFNNGATTAPYLFPFYTDEPTGVDAIAANNDNGKAPVFSIDGKMVSKTSDSETLNKLGKGIYIINKKKVVIQ